MGNFRSSGLALIVAGILGIAFFWLTDPRYGLTKIWIAGENAIDQANQDFTGTLVGVIGCAAMVVTGLWLMSKRSA